MTTHLQHTQIECIRGDIAAQTDIDTVVNAANAELRIGGGVAGAIHRAAGPGLYQECRPLAPIAPGEAVITGAHNLPNRHVIHCLGPVFGVDEPADALLAACYRNALQLVHQHSIDSIAFPAISAGTFGYPMAAAARVAFTAIFDFLQQSPGPELIRFVLFDDADRRLHETVLTEIQARYR